MELTPENTLRIYALPPAQLRRYLPRIFAKVRDPAPGDGPFVQSYVLDLKKIFTQLKFTPMGPLRPGTGWDSLHEACVDCGIVETYISLLQHPRDDYHPALFFALDSLVDIGTTANGGQRRILFNKAMQCNALNVCLSVMKNAELCLHKHSAVRFVRAICADMYLGETLSSTQTAELLETLLRNAYEEIDSYSVELRNPGKSWQVAVMVSGISTDPETASRYGKRWFGLSQELVMFAVQSLLCRYPIPSRQYVLEVIEARPQIIDLLLDIGNLPRPDFYPETQVDSTALETLAFIFQFPIRIIAGIDLPSTVPRAVKEERDNDWQATVAASNLLVSRPGWLSKILNIWKKLDAETIPILERQLARVHPDWGGAKPEESTINTIFEYRGLARISILHMVRMATHAEDIKSSDLLSLLRIAYVAAQAAISPTRDRPPTIMPSDILACMERITDLFRFPVSMAYISDPRDFDRDATSHMPAQGVGAPTALLRLLSVLEERGILEDAQSWSTLPAGCAPGTDLRQVKQILSPPVIKKLIPLVIKRMSASRELARMDVATQQWKVRARYVEAAQLGAALLAFDRATEERWGKTTRGLKKELVLCLGNASEMSIRRLDFDAALGFAAWADAVAQAADSEEGITEDTISKNQRRIQTAQQGLKATQTDV